MTQFQQPMHQKIGNYCRNIKQQAALQSMVVPMLILLLLFSYFPMYGILIAFKNFSISKGIWDSPWAFYNGMEHFIDLFSAPAFPQILRNTICIAVLKLVITCLPPMILAIALNELKRPVFQKVNQTISYLPYFLSWVVVSGLLYQFFNPTTGAVNTVLKNCGLIDNGVDFISDPSNFWTIAILSDLWKNMGWGSVIYLGMIATIDPSLYEALRIDGGGRIDAIRHITWPHLKETFVIMFIMACGNIMTGGGTFDQCYLLGNTFNRETSDILNTYVLRVGISQGRYSFATAVGLFQSVCNLILLLSANAVSKKLTEKALF